MIDREQTLNERQAEMHETLTPSCNNIAYPTCEIIEEVGELIEKLYRNIQWCDGIDGGIQYALQRAMIDVKFSARIVGDIAKQMRHESVALPFTLKAGIAPQVMTDIALEVGDIEWGLGVLAQQMGFSAQQIADMNYAKLSSRKAQGTIDGKGDHQRETID